MSLDQFIQQNNGNGLDFDGYYGDQCVDLAQFYNRDVLGNPTRFTGNAADIFGQQPDKFDWVANTPSGVPQKGDIMIWDGALNGGPGHIAIFVAGDAKQFTSFDQNWPTGSNCHLQGHNYNYVKGWGHFKSQQGEIMQAQDIKNMTGALFMTPADAQDLAMAGQNWHDVMYALAAKYQHLIRDKAAQVTQLQLQVDDLTKQVKNLTTTVADLQKQLAASKPEPAPPPQAPTPPPSTPAPTVHPAWLASLLQSLGLYH